MVFLRYDALEVKFHWRCRRAEAKTSSKLILSPAGSDVYLVWTLSSLRGRP